eukprot:TRINITY_DN15592_c0_g1_i1.p1 TRINITY_DN15592_c0_g1~~TRINITY_DN15592_c0_g1_i1.p1  ORF type:complete len:369 (-),score=33.64 TRINITY_DN15592_c0_g1_i1:56-1162(-)
MKLTLINSIFILIGAGLTFVTLCISLFLIICHLRNYTQPKQQRCIVRICIMVPLYAVYSLLALIFPRQQTYFAVFRDCYEAYALYMFFVLCIEYAGGQKQMEANFLQQNKMRLVMPFWCYFQPSARVLMWCRRGILQYALIRPLVTIASAILLPLDKYGEGSWKFDKGYVYATIINNICVTVALYFLVLFYKVVKEDLKPYRPLLKFSVIKLIVVFCYWQSLILLVLAQFKFIPPVDPDVTTSASMLQNLAICFEMLIFSILFLYAFPYQMYRVGALSQAPLIREVQLGGDIKGSITDMVNQKDMVKDTYESFVPKFKRDNTGKKFRKVKENGDNSIQVIETDARDDDTNIELDIIDDKAGINNTERR